MFHGLVSSDMMYREGLYLPINRITCHCLKWRYTEPRFLHLHLRLALPLPAGWARPVTWQMEQTEVSTQDMGNFAQHDESYNFLWKLKPPRQLKRETQFRIGKDDAKLQKIAKYAGRAGGMLLVGTSNYYVKLRVCCCAKCYYIVKC